MSLDGVELFARIAVAAALGGAIGVERELGDQPAGFRTHILVSLGAALFTLGGAYGVEGLLGGDARVGFDPTRVAAQIVTGIGFLGAGAIIQQGPSVRGLTTAASLWVTAAIGMGAGLGYYEATVMTTVVALVALVALKPLERHLVDRFSRRRHKLVVEAGVDFRVGELRRALEERGVFIGTFKVTTEEAGERERYIMVIRIPRGISQEHVVKVAETTPGVERATWYG